MNEGRERFFIRQVLPGYGSDAVRGSELTGFGLGDPILDAHE